MGRFRTREAAGQQGLHLRLRAGRGFGRGCDRGTHLLLRLRGRLPVGDEVIHGSEVSNVGWVAIAGVVGFLGNELVAQFRIRVGKKIGSAALVADGQHARTDGFTSLAVVLGSLGVAFGFPILDPLVGLGITVAILFIVKDSAFSIWRRMMDAVEPEIVDSIEKVAADVSGVEQVQSVRARWVGHRVYSEVEIGVAESLSVGEVARIRERLSSEAKRAVPKLERLVVQAVPCG